jgi:hypothetical protein
MLQGMTEVEPSQPQGQPTSTLPARPQRDAKGHWLKGVSGNARGTLEGSRRAFSAAFIRTLADDFRLHGRQAIEKVRKTQPAAYLKVCALLVPREHKVEHRNLLKDLTDEELEAAIDALRAMMATQAENAKVIEGTDHDTALPVPTECEQPPYKRRNRLLEHADAAIGPSRKPR